MKTTEQYQLSFHINAFNYSKCPLITDSEPSLINMFNWGLIRTWVKGEEKANELKINTLNAKCETIFEKPSFRSAIIKKRCLIPATGFFEWRHHEKKKYPYLIGLKNEPIFSFAGIWETWNNINTFSIITTEANSLMAQIHNTKLRMPIILRPEQEKIYLDKSIPKDDLAKLLKNHIEESEMSFHTISNLITSRT